MKALVLLAGLLLCAVGRAADTVTPQADFGDHREPPAYRVLSAFEREASELGQAVFNTQWVPAGTPRAQRRDGLGPVFNAASCDACHNNGARGQGPADSGPLPVAVVIQLSHDGGPDPHYGYVLNTAAIDGVEPEAAVRVVYDVREGRYRDGRTWRLRAPRYELTQLSNGALAASTVVKPRLAPALFGAGLLEAVPQAALLRRSARQPAGLHGRTAQADGRFGWQADSPSLADQTARALSREMGLGSRLMPLDDCGTANCRDAADGGEPEVSDDFFAALLAFQRPLAVPRSRAGVAEPAKAAALFAATGCAGCHLPELPVAGIDGLSRIGAYTDLLLHDLGADLADRDARGDRVASRWRTAPLWGIGHLGRAGAVTTLLHDGRARSIEEAILWHGGEATSARARFEQLPASQRQRLIDWVSSR